MYTLPTEIELNNSILHIRGQGDFRIILDCFSALQDTELDKEYRILTALFIFYGDFDSIDQVCNYSNIEQAVVEMFKFFSCNEPTDGKKSNDFKLIDWELDEQIISSAINKVAGKEIRIEPYIHWWTFMGYYNSVGESVLSTIIGIRKKIAEGKKLEKHEREFKRDNPQYFNRDYRSADQRAADEEFRKLWNQS